MNCRICNESGMFRVVDLGHQPASNQFFDLTASDSIKEKYPLVAWACVQCAFMQVEDHLEAIELFHENYSYLSSYSCTFVRHARNQFDVLHKRFFGKKKIKFYEIASNDGYLLNHIIGKGHDAIGIEPTKLAAGISKAKGHTVIERFIDKASGEDIAQQWGRADFVIGNNVLAHTPDIVSFLCGARSLLNKNGVIVFENPHLLNLIQKVQFDTIYHEHFSYLSVTSVCKAFKKAGLKLIDVKASNIHGGSIQYIGVPLGSNMRVERSVNEVSTLEDRSGLKNHKTYRHFANEVLDLKREAIDWINSVDQNTLICGYGAAAKATVFLNFIRANNQLIRFLVDKNPEKQNKQIPGTDIPIQSVDHLVRTKPEFVVIFVWNLKDEILSELRKIVTWKCTAVFFLPKLTLESI